MSTLKGEVHQVLPLTVTNNGFFSLSPFLLASNLILAALVTNSVDHNYVRLSKPWCLSDLNQSDAPTPPTKTANGTGGQCLLNAPSNGKVDDTMEIPVAESMSELGPEQLLVSDYTNASLVPGRAPGVAYCLVGSDRLPRTYIAAQAPVDHTRGLFWQMIWDHGVKLIVLLTKVRENGKDKCSVYWPGSTGRESPNETGTMKRTVRFGQLTIKLRDENSTNTHVKRRFDVRRTNDPKGEERTITQLHMMQWPDFSAPSKDHFSALLFAYWAERRCCANVEAPVLIHCSAGVGRTGTFICLDQLCQQVRYYLQPDFQPFLLTATRSTVADEPIYANLNTDSDEPGVRNSLRLGDTDGTDTPTTRSSKALSISAEQTATSRDADGNSAWPTLLPTTWNVSGNRGWSLGRMKRFGLGRKKTHCVNVYKTVLWLRSHRSYMVQSEDQYLFIYRYLSHFIQQINDSEQIYENI
ncbi:unnamed protein product [Echinostoma caproni]|uniref:Protein-tyrosine-phosphatase n=1 Tax=Echinostoma caproni TaxID=27848 RepID=A0A183APH2_9TREM|nr:unnamed protein product [Echinostoma caproni]